jgi:hypothetical protein
MPLPPARTPYEAHLYMDLHPCDRCGGIEVAWESALIDDGGSPARRYWGACGDCGANREFVFALPETQVSTEAESTVSFGGPEPSRLLDPGEWLLVADLCAQAGAGQDDEARYNLEVAVAAMAEILKFAPACPDAVPASAFTSARGRTVYQQEPGRFDRRRLQVVRASYRDSLDRLG